MTTLFSRCSKKPNFRRTNMFSPTTIRSAFLCVSLCVLVLGSGNAFGEDVDEVGTIVIPQKRVDLLIEEKAKPTDLPDADEVVQMALENNPDIAVAKAKVQEAQAELNRTQWR